MGALKSDFSHNTRFSWFYSKILVGKSIWPARLRNFLFKRFGDQTNTKLCWEAESAICIELFQKKGHATGLQLKNRENWYFGSESLLETLFRGFSSYMLCKPVACPFLWKSSMQIADSASQQSFVLVWSPKGFNKKL